MFHEGKLPRPERVDDIGPLWKPATIEGWAKREWWARGGGGEGWGPSENPRWVINCPLATYCFMAMVAIVSRKSHLNFNR